MTYVVENFSENIINYPLGAVEEKENETLFPGCTKILEVEAHKVNQCWYSTLPGDSTTLEEKVQY